MCTDLTRRLKRWQDIAIDAFNVTSIFQTVAQEREHKVAANQPIPEKYTEIVEVFNGMASD